MRTLAEQKHDVRRALERVGIGEQMIQRMEREIDEAELRGSVGGAADLERRRLVYYEYEGWAFVDEEFFQKKPDTDRVTVFLNVAELERMKGHL